MRLYFIRHGEPDYDTDSLTEKGVEQAELLAERLKDIPFSEIHHSPLGRAKQTGQICFVKKRNDLSETPWLKEIEWGDKSGNAYSTDSPWSIIERMIKERHSYPAGDSWKNDPWIIHDRIVQDVEKRCSEFDEFMKNHGYVREGQLYRIDKAFDEDVAFFCHGGISCALVSHLLNIPFWQFVVHYPMDMTAITKINVKGKQGNYTAAEVDFINNYSHLPYEKMTLYDD